MHHGRKRGVYGKRGRRHETQVQMLGKEIKKKLKYLYGKVHKFSNTTRAGKNQREK